MKGRLEQGSCLLDTGDSAGGCRGENADPLFGMDQDGLDQKDRACLDVLEVKPERPDWDDLDMYG